MAVNLPPPSSTLAAYPEKDQSVLARYARAIAYYRIPQLDKALPTIDGLIRDFPQDPYFRELKGQMLFENGRVAEAQQPYEEAVRLAPAAPLLRISLAQTYVESNDPKLNKRAIAYLNLGDAYFELQRKPEAKDAYERFLDLAPNSKTAPAVREKLNSLP